MEKSKKLRDSNIELCRIIAMLLIIAHHFVVHGGGLRTPQYSINWIAAFVQPGGKICFDTFIAISCWFLADQKFRADRFVKLYLETIFYSVVTAIIATFLGVQLSGVEWFSALLPITGGVQGYVQTYIAFYLMVPFLSKISANITKNQNKFAVLLLGAFCIVFRIMSTFIKTEQSVFCRLILFVFIYFVILYAKRYPIKMLESPLCMFSVFTICWLLAFVYNVETAKYPDLTIWPYLRILVHDEGGLLNIFGGLALFFLFKNIKIKPNRVINTLGGTTLAVILLHDGHFSRKHTWALFKPFYIQPDGAIIPTLIRFAICVPLVYIICSVIDLLRRKFLEKPLFNSKWMQVLCSGIDNFLADDEYEGNPLSDESKKYIEKCKELETELDRKNRALAELATRYVNHE
ncbi:MAG: acyltransferase [Huintestinicola sp.]